MSEAYDNLPTLKFDLDEKMTDDGKIINTVKRTGAAGLFLGLLCFIFLTVILALVVQNSHAIGYWSQHQVTRHEHGNLTSQVTELQTRFNNFTEKGKKAFADEDALSTGPCPVGWVEVNRKCYFISTRGVSKNWVGSRKDCDDQGARLVTIKTRSELEVLSLFHEHAWIGLSDREHEGRWMWEDGTALENSDLWMPNEPNNADDNEDCAHLNTISKKVGLNDNNCGTAFSYICEAKV